MSKIIDGIDHTLVGVADLEESRARWTRLGFTCVPRGSHIGWGTANYCIMFPDDYIELLGIVDPAEFTNNLDVFLQDGEGLLGFAFRTADADALKADLDGRGVASDGPKDLARTLELPGGNVLPRFKLLFTPPEVMPGLRAFFCQHLTPEILRRPEWLVHANGAKGVADVTSVVADPAEIAPAYEKVFGAPACAITDGVLTVTVAGHGVRLMSPAAAAAAYPGLAPAEPPASPRMLAQAIAVADLEATAAYLSGAGVVFDRPTGGVVRVPPNEANGGVLDFVAG